MKKYRYVCLTVLLGVVLLLWPQQTRQEEPTAESEPECEPQVTGTVQAEEIISLEERLTALLSQIEGAGEVACMVTVRDSGTREYLCDHSTDASGVERTETVVLNRDETGQEPVLVTTLTATLQGVAVVCDGAEDAAVRLKIVQTVAAVTGLGTDHITVVKRESNQH